MATQKVSGAPIISMGFSRTVSVLGRDDATHANSWGAFEKGPSDNSVRLGDGVAATGNGQDAVMNTLDNLANSGLDASLITEIGDVLAALANDHTSLLGGHDSSQSKSGLGVFFVGSGSRLAIGAEALLVVVDVEVIESLFDAAAVGGNGVLVGGHDVFVKSWETGGLRGWGSRSSIWMEEDEISRRTTSLEVVHVERGELDWDSLT